MQLNSKWISQSGIRVCHRSYVFVRSLNRRPSKYIGGLNSPRDWTIPSATNESSFRSFTKKNVLPARAIVTSKWVARLTESVAPGNRAVGSSDPWLLFWLSYINLHTGYMTFVHYCFYQQPHHPQPEHVRHPATTMTSWLLTSSRRVLTHHQLRHLTNLLLTSPRTHRGPIRSLMTRSSLGDYRYQVVILSNHNNIAIIV